MQHDNIWIIISVPLLYLIYNVCELGGSEGLKNKEKGDLKRKKECRKLTKTRSRYVSVQNICVQHNKCTFPKSYENWCPVYSS